MRLGVTNLVAHATASASELTADNLRRGARQLEGKVLKFEPAILAILGVGAYRTAFNRPDAKLGLQDESIGRTKIWVLPNPSGLNAHFQLDDLARLMRELRLAAGRL